MPEVPQFSPEQKLQIRELQLAIAQRGNQINQLLKDSAELNQRLSATADSLLKAIGFKPEDHQLDPQTLRITARRTPFESVEHALESGGATFKTIQGENK
jgi:hypothetical protein